jgi:hypothetical protein
VKLVSTFIYITEKNKFLMIRGNHAHVCLPYDSRQPCAHSCSETCAHIYL